MHLALVNGWPATVRVAVTIGFLGGFTTYSSFNYETMRLMEEGAAATALANVLLTLLGGFGAGWLGLLLARQLAGR
jgi:CrcB protein